MIKNGKIEDVLPISSLSQLPKDTKTEDLGSLLVFPGLIDLNVSFASDGASTVTKQALSGGTTLVCTLDQASGDLYTDILPILHFSDQTPTTAPSSFAHKSYLVPQGPNPQVLTQLDKLKDLPQDIPLIVHPELATADNMSLSTPFRQVEAEKRVFCCKIIINDDRNIMASEFRLDSDEEVNEEEDGELDNSESCSEDYGPEIVVNDFDGGERNEADGLNVNLDSMLLNVPCIDRKRVSLPSLSNSDPSLKHINSPRHRSFQVLGLNSRPVPLQDVPFINKGIQVEQAYHEHISKFPEDWETAAVKLVLQARPAGRIHFCNVSSSEAVKVISSEKSKRSVPASLGSPLPQARITCETSLPYIYFSESDIKPGDTRYKLNPPIRDHLNYKNLWQMIRNKEIDCISSYHQPVAPPCKFIGDFTRAVNGVISAGFLLQAVWTRLRAQVSLEDEGQYLAFMADLLCKNPASILGLSTRGGITKGKSADLVIWDPDARGKVMKTFDKFPEMSPMIGEEVYGVVHRTYLRGELVFINNEFTAKGRVVIKEEEIR